VLQWRKGLGGTPLQSTQAQTHSCHGWSRQFAKYSDEQIMNVRESYRVGSTDMYVCGWGWTEEGKARIIGWVLCLLGDGKLPRGSIGVMDKRKEFVHVCLLTPYDSTHRGCTLKNARSRPRCGPCQFCFLQWRAHEGRISRWSMLRLSRCHHEQPPRFWLLA